MAKLGEDIVSCEPFAYVVNQSLNRLVCDFCLASAPTPGRLMKCAGCKYVYYCGKECQRPAWRDHREECAYLRAIAPKVPTDTVRLIARIILKLRSGGGKTVAVLPDGSKRRFDDLLTHTRDIVNDSCRIRAFSAFFGVLQDIFRDSVPPKAEVLDIYGRVIINSFNIMSQEYNAIGVGLYLEASAFDHSCRPNAAVCFDGRKIHVKCIEKGMEAADFSDWRISYCNLLNPAGRRRKDLREQYYFECRCEGCSDEASDEEQRRLSCMRCPACSHGIVVREEADRGREQLKCRHCHLEVPRNHACEYWNLRDRVINAVFLNTDKHPEPMERSADFVHEMRPLFHPSERNYLDVLEHCLESAMSAEDWRTALDIGRECLVGYEALYPRHDVNTGLLLMKLAKLANYLEWTADAHSYVRRAEEMLDVCYGAGHPFVRDTVLKLKFEVEQALKVEKEEDGDKGSKAAGVDGQHNQSG